MLRLSRNSVIDFEKYKRHLSYLGFIYYDMDYISKRLTVMQEQLDTMRYLLNVYVRECSGDVILNADNTGVRKFLINYRSVPENLLYTRVKGEYKPSISKEVLSRVRDMGYAVDFIDLYLDFTSLRTKTGLVRSVLYKCRESDTTSQDGSALYKVTHRFQENGTMRTYYNDFNHQQLDKDDLKALKAPKGYTLVTGDFAQSDFKIAYNMLLRDPSNIDTMFRYKDSYEAIARVLEGPNFSKEKFKEDRNVYKKCSLAPLYGAKSASTIKEKNITNMMGEYYNTLKPYKTFKNNIQKRMKLGLPIVIRTYFGTEVMVNTYGKQAANVLNSYLSAPCQTGTSEVVIACANSIMDKFAEYGITEENGGIYLAYNKHDELMFYLKNEHLQYSWIFQDNQNIVVDGWMPLQIEFSFSDIYGVPNDEIDKTFKSMYKEETPLNVDELIAEAEKADFFIPCEGVLEIAIGHYFDYDNGRTIIAMIDLATDSVVYNEIMSVDPEKVVQSIILLINRNAENLKRNNITASIVYSTLMNVDKTFGGEVIVGFKCNYDNGLFNRANKLVSDKFRSLIDSENSEIYKTDYVDGEYKDKNQLVHEAIDYLLNIDDSVESLSKYNPSGPTPTEQLIAIFKGQPIPKEDKNVIFGENDLIEDDSVSLDSIDLDFDLDSLNDIFK